MHNNFQLPQSYDVDHKVLWPASTLASLGFLRASEVTFSSSSFPPTAHLCLRVITFILNIESPNRIIVPLLNLKPAPFAKAVP